MFDVKMFTLIFTGIWCLVGAIFLFIGLWLRRSAQNRVDRLRARMTDIARGWASQERVASSPNAEAPFVRTLECLEEEGEEMARKVADYKATLGKKIEKANQDLAAIGDYEFKTN